MVQTDRPFYEDEQTSFRRFSTRANGYALNHERGLPPTALPLSYEESRTNHLSNRELRHDEPAAASDSNMRPRSRIPVACQRCRKRKIRCSGDNGGGACSNCRNAGCAEQCQFLRVSSQDVSMKADTTITEYMESPAASRFQYRMVAQTPPFVQTSPSAEFDSYQYRSNSATTYAQYGNRNYGSGMSYADFESPVDYGLQSSPHQLIPQEHFRTPSPICNQIRGWHNVSQLPRGSELFVEQEQQIYIPEHLSVIAKSSLPFSTTNHTDPKDIEEPGLSSLSHSNMCEPNERPILPNPVANRPGPISALLRNNDSHSSTTQLGNYKAHHDSQYRDMNMVHQSKAQSQSTASDNYTHDIRFSNTSHEPLAYGENSNTMPPGHHHDGLYATTTNMHYHPNATASMSRQFAQVPPTVKTDSYIITSRSRDGLPGIADGELSNGHPYIPYRNSSSSYPTPPMGVPPLPPVQRTACIQSHQ